MTAAARKLISSEAIFRPKPLMIMALGVISSVAISACASPPAALPAPEPVIREVPVNVPVPTPCVTGVPDEPSYSDSDAALHSAPDIFAGTKLLLAGRIERRDYIGKLRATLQSCVGAKP